MDIEIIGESKLKDSDIEEIVSGVVSKFRKNNAGTVEIVFSSSDEIRKLNKTYRKLDQPTDVLSFPQAKISGKNILGTIIICEEEGESRREKTEELIRHGLLHLFNFDHEQDKIGWSKAADRINHKM